MSCRKTSATLSFLVLVSIINLCAEPWDNFVSAKLPSDRGRIAVDTVKIPDPNGSGEIDGYTLRTDQGSLLRGVSIGLESDAKYFEMLSEKGINAVRYIFFDPYWRFATGAEDYLHFDGSEAEKVNDFMHRLERLVNLASIYGIYVMINFHAVFPYTECPNLPDCSLDDIPQYCNEFWNTVAPCFKDRTHVIYEILNEPMYMYDWTEQMIQDQKDMYDNIHSHAPETHIVLASISGISENEETNSKLLNLAKRISDKGIDWTNASIGYHPYHSDGTSKSILLAMSQFPVINTEQNVPYSFVSECIGCDPYGSDEMDGERWGVQTHEKLQIGWLHWVMDNEIKINHNYKALLNDAQVKGYLWQFDSPVSGSPEVEVGKDTTLYLPAQSSLTINAQVTDPGGKEIIEYKWEQYSSSTGIQYLAETDKPSVSISNLDPGIYAFLVTVKNDEGFIGSDALKVTVTYKHSLPCAVEAEYFSNMYGIQVGGANDIDPDGNPASSGNTGYQDDGDWLEYTVNTGEKGKYEIEMRVGRGSSGNGEGQFEINGAAVSPLFTVPFTGEDWSTYTSVFTSVFLQQGEQILRLNIITGPWNNNWMKFTRMPFGVHAGADTSVLLPETTSIKLKGDTAGNIASILWEKISGPGITLSNENTVDLNVSGLLEGTYTFRMTVTDDKGNTDTDEVDVTANYGLKVNAGKDKSIKLPTSSVRLYATVQNVGITVSYLWENISGPDFTIDNDQIRNPMISDLSEGIYIFRVTARNELNFTATDEIIVTVSAANGMINTSLEKSIIVYPNPASTYFVLKLNPNLNTAYCSLTSLNGQVVLYKNLSGTVNHIELPAGLLNGTYMITLVTDLYTIHRMLIVQ